MRLPKKPSPAIVIACLALFVALGGTAIATGRYVITSTSQIMPSVRSALVAPGPDVEIASPEVSIKQGTIGSTRADCPTGDHIVTGGYIAELAPGAYVTLDRPRGTHGWSVLVNSQHGTGVSKIRVDGLCAPGSIATVGKSYR